VAGLQSVEARAIAKLDEMTRQRHEKELLDIVAAEAAAIKRKKNFAAAVKKAPKMATRNQKKSRHRMLVATFARIKGYALIRKVFANWHHTALTLAATNAAAAATTAGGKKAKAGTQKGKGENASSSSRGKKKSTKTKPVKSAPKKLPYKKKWKNNNNKKKKDRKKNAPTPTPSRVDPKMMLGAWTDQGGVLVCLRKAKAFPIPVVKKDPAKNPGAKKSTPKALKPTRSRKIAPTEPVTQDAAVVDTSAAAKCAAASALIFDEREARAFLLSREYFHATAFSFYVIVSYVHTGDPSLYLRVPFLFAALYALDNPVIPYHPPPSLAISVSLRVPLQVCQNTCGVTNRPNKTKARSSDSTPRSSVTCWSWRNCNNTNIAPPPTNSNNKKRDNRLLHVCVQTRTRRDNTVLIKYIIIKVFYNNNNNNNKTIGLALLALAFFSSSFFHRRSQNSELQQTTVRYVQYVSYTHCTTVCMHD
jgi:hypothetical protein